MADSANKSRAKKSRSKKSRGKARQSNNLMWILIGVGVVALIAVPIVLNAVQAANLPGERFASQGNAHIAMDAEHPAYNSNPPTSGWHTPELTAWRAYDYVVPEERLIHNMEDGGVILWYRMGSEEQNRERIDALQEVSNGYRRIVIAPREEMPTEYALTAWQRLQRFDEIDREGMRTFIDAYEGIDNHR